MKLLRHPISFIAHEKQWWMGFNGGKGLDMIYMQRTGHHFHNDVVEMVYTLLIMIKNKSIYK